MKAILISLLISTSYVLFAADSSALTYDNPSAIKEFGITPTRKFVLDRLKAEKDAREKAAKESAAKALSASQAAEKLKLADESRRRALRNSPITDEQARAYFYTGRNVLLDPKWEGTSYELGNAISDQYYEGSFLIFDCINNFWACVSEQGAKSCQTRRELAINAGFDFYPCAYVKLFNDIKTCRKKQSEVVIKQLGNDICYPKIIPDYD